MSTEQSNAKYTVVYTDSFMSGSHRYTHVHDVVVELRPNQKLEEELAELGIDATRVVFVYEGEHYNCLADLM